MTLTTRGIVMKRVSFVFIAFLIVSLVLPLYQIPEVKAQESSGSFGNSEITVYNWTKFWSLFNAHTMWDLEYNNGSGWISDKSQLQIIKNYTKRVTVFKNATHDEIELWATNKSEADSCKITLNFTALYLADYRLTFGIDLDVKNYTHKEGSWNYTLTYKNHMVYFDWTDIKELPLDSVQHGVKPVGDDRYFWFRIRKNNVPQGYNVIIDPSFGKTDIGASDFALGETRCWVCKYTLSEDGDISKITAYVKMVTTAGNMKVCLYDDSASVPNNLLAESSPVAIGTTYSWVEFTVSYSASAGVYHMGTIQDEGASIKRDSGTSAQVNYKTMTYPTFDNPFGTPGGTRDYETSIYANYTTAEEEYTEEFTNTIGISASLYLWKALSEKYTETITITATSYSWREKSVFFTETTIITETSNFAKELLLEIVEFSELIQFDADIILTFGLVVPEVEPSTFGTLGLVIAIIALAIAVTTFTAKKRS